MKYGPSQKWTPPVHFLLSKVDLGGPVLATKSGLGGVHFWQPKMDRGSTFSQGGPFLNNQ